MKNLLLPASLLISLITYSQETETVNAVAVTTESIEIHNDFYKVRSKEMIIDEDKNTIEYNGGVVLITDVITLEADKVIFNKENKEVTATGNFRFKGVPLKLKANNSNNILRYTLGDHVAYLE